MNSKINLEVTLLPSEADEYGEEGMKALLIDILERYGSEEYFDPDLAEQYRKEEKQ